MIWKVFKRRTNASLLIISSIAALIFLLLFKYKTREMKVINTSARLEFTIRQQWHSQPTDHGEISIHLTASESGLTMTVDAPLFNDPPSPGTAPGQPLDGLWNYEVVEAFFLNGNKQYLEVELCPHGQHLVLMLSDYRKVFKQLLPLEYTASVSGDRWRGVAVIPWQYLPPGVSRFNAYAIHGTDPHRVYEALFPTPRGQFAEPDFHRLEFFGEVDFSELWPRTESGERAAIDSTLWT